VIKRISKPGRRPERIVYELTPKGLERFNKLLSKSLLNFKRPQFNLDLSLYFLHYMKPSIARRRLSARLHILDKISQELKLMVKSSERKKGLSLWRILDHNLGMLEAEKEFLTSLIKSI
jgi:DNA-binding PadR family transcriptional regulator